MTLAVGETNRTRINSEIVQLGTRTTALEGLFPISGGVLTYSGDVDGYVPVEQIFRLDSDLAGADSSGAKVLLGVGCTLAASTVYDFEIVAVLAKTAGTTSHLIALGMGGSATYNNIFYDVVYNTAPSVAASGAASLIYHSTSGTTVDLTTAITTADNVFRLIVRGTVSVNAGGTFFPQYALSAAPGGGYSTKAGSFMRIAPIGASGSNTSIGAWS